MAKTLAFFLLALVLTCTPVDDVFAGLTEDPPDDAIASANNEYLPPSAAQNPRLPDHGTPLPDAPELCPGFLPAHSPCRGRLTEAHALVLPGPDPVYVLMSLRR